MGMFVSGRVAITAAGVTDEKDITPATDVIYIRVKMDYGTRQRVIGAAAKLVTKSPGGRAARRGGRKGQAAGDMDFDIGAYQIALLAQNVLAWAGPSFAGVACTPANVELLDTDEPLVAAVIQAISDRNIQADAEPDEDEESGGPNGREVTPTVKSLTTSTGSA